MMARVVDFLGLSFIRTRSALNSLFRPGRRPPAAILEDQLAHFTMHHEVPVLELYLNDTTSKPLKWTTSSRWWNPERVKQKGHSYYKETDTFLYSALDKFDIRDKEVVIVGSEMPWYECVCTSYLGKVTTIDYREVDCQIPELTVLTPDEFVANPKEFDVAVSISSLEHDGLGRYGDPIDPEGDLKAIQNIKRLLKPGGLFFFRSRLAQMLWFGMRIAFMVGRGSRNLPKVGRSWIRLDSPTRDSTPSSASGTPSLYLCYGANEPDALDFPHPLQIRLRGSAS